MVRITQLCLKDFRGHQSLSLPLGAATWVRGPNGSGKSALRHALEWLLTGRVGDLGTGLRNAAPLLVRSHGAPGGAIRASVTAQIENLGELVREVPSRLRAESLGDGATEQHLVRALGLPPPGLIGLACHPASLAECKPDEVRDLLFQGVMTHLTGPELLAALEEFLHADGVEPAAARRIVTEAQAQLPADPTPADLDALYHRLYEERREANGAVRALKHQLAFLIQLAEEGDGDADSAAAQARARLSALRNQEASLIVASGSQRGLEADLAEVRRMIEAEIDRLQELSAQGGRRGALVTAIRQAEEARAAAEREAAHHQWMVQAFRPCGFKAVLMRRHLFRLQREVDRRLGDLLGPRWGVRFDPAGQQPLRLAHPLHPEAPLQSLSTAERSLVGIAVADALNDYHQLGLLCIDDLEQIGSPLRERLLRLVEGWARTGRYGTILLLQVEATADLTSDVLVHL